MQGYRGTRVHPYRYSEVFTELRKTRPHYRIAILEVTCSRSTMHKRATLRAEATGRVVPASLLDETYDQVGESVKVLTAFADHVIRIENETEPTITDHFVVTGRMADGTGCAERRDLCWKQYKQLWRRQPGEHFDTSASSKL